jgi:hypothetical protein
LILKLACHVEVPPVARQYRKLDAAELYWKVTTREIARKYPKISHFEHRPLASITLFFATCPEQGNQRP